MLVMIVTMLVMLTMLLLLLLMMMMMMIMMMIMIMIMVVMTVMTPHGVHLYDDAALGLARLDELADHHHRLVRQRLQATLKMIDDE
jgi:hypothetical protein